MSNDCLLGHESFRGFERGRKSACGHIGIYAYVKVLNDKIERGDPQGALEDIRRLARTVALAQEQNRSRAQ